MLLSLTLQALALVLPLGSPTELWKSVSRGMKCKCLEVLWRRWLLAPGWCLGMLKPYLGVAEAMWPIQGQGERLGMGIMV